MSHPAISPAPRSMRIWCAFLALAVAAIAAPGVASAADLNATPSNLSSVYSSAQGGDVIHLAAGNYGNFGGGSKASVVTLVAQSGATATISPNLGAGVNNLRFDGLTIDGAYTNGARNTAFVNSRFTGLVRVDTPANVSNANILFDRDTFDGLSATASSYEGRLTVRGYENNSPVGVKITNSHFGNGGCSDGVQIIGGAYGVEIGPGNEISGIKQASCSNHVDSIQLYGSSHTQIVGNYFHDSDTVIMAPDGGDAESITDNVMLGSGYVSAVQLGSQDGTQFRHNTVKNIQVQTGSKVGGSASRNVVVQDNAFAQGADLNPSQGSGCSNCPTSYNLFATSGAASGSNTVVGTPVFTGGSSPTTYSGYQLASNSPGKANASDGADRGIRTSGSPPPPPPPPGDTTAPETTITSGPTGTTTDSTPTFAFSSSEAGSTFECRLDAGAYVACTSPKAYSGLSTGSHSFSVRAKDAAGNVDASPATRSWTIQSAAPADHQPVAAYAYSPTTPAPGQAVSFDASSATCDDAPCTYTWVDDGPDGPGGAQWPLGNGKTMTFTFQDPGVKNVRVAVTDADGDTDSTMKSVTVSSAPPADTTAPETTIDSGPTGTTSDNTPTFAFSSSEGGSTFACRVDSGSWASCASPWTTSALSDGAHSVAVRATDAAGNTDASPATRSFTVATVVAGGQNLLGSSAIESAADGEPSGQAEAFQATATGSGSAVSLSIYVDSGNRATTLVAGLYSDANGHPGTLLNKGTKSAPTAGTWNKVTIAATALSSGKKYWIALMGTGGTLRYRDGAGGPNCHSETYATNSLTTLPTTWRSGASWASCPLSGYATN
jgi:hypothetical protein